MINDALRIASLTRARLGGAGSVMLQVAPQAAIQAARMVQNALANAKGKLDIRIVVAPHQVSLAEAASVEAAKRSLPDPRLAGDGPGAEAPQQWGSLGDIEFDIVDSPTALSGKEGMNYARHNVLCEKQRLQFTAPKLDETTLTLSLHSSLAAEPWQGVEWRYGQLRDAMQEREVMELVIGSSGAGSMAVGEYVITDIERTVKKFNPDGSLMAMDLTVKLLEWAEAPEMVVTEAPKAASQNKNASPAQKAQAQEVKKDGQGNVLDSKGAAYTNKPKV